MRTVLEMLYDGKIDPAEAVDVTDAVYQEIIKKHADAEKYLKQRLSEEDICQLDKYSDLEFERSSIYAYRNFRYGFKLATLLMYDLFIDNTAHKE